MRARRVLLHTHIFEQVGSRVHGVLHHHFHRWKKSPSQASYNKHQKQISHHNSPEDGIDRNKPNAVNPMNTMRSAYALFITTTITAVVPSTAWVPMHMILGTGPSHLQGGGQHWLPVGLQHHGHQGEDSGIQQDSQCLHQPYWWDISLSQASGRLNLKIRSKFDFLEDNVASKRPIPSPTEPLPTTTCFTVSLTFMEFTIPISKLFSLARLTDEDLLFWFLPTRVCRVGMCKFYEPTYAKTISRIAEKHCHSHRHGD